MRSLRSKHARRRQYRHPNTLRLARRKVTVHRHHYRRFAGTGIGHRLAVRRAAHGRAVQKAHRASTGHRKHSALSRALHHRRHGYHVHRRKGYHVHRRKGYHLKHKRHLLHKIHRRRGLRHPHKGSHAHRKHGYHQHRRHGLKHPHRGWHGHRHFKGRRHVTHKPGWHRKKTNPPKPQPLSAASYLSMF